MRRISDLFASRLGFAVALGALLAVLGVALWYVELGMRDAPGEETLAQERQLRNAYTALGDVQRLHTALFEALREGVLTEALEVQFADALDFLFVRADTMDRRQDMVGHRDAVEGAVASLQALVETVDGILASGERDPKVFARPILDASDEARRALTVFMDDMRRLQEQILSEQSRALRRQQRLLLATMVGLSAIGAGALILLRREVINRQRRERAERRADFLAFFDPLTTLPNRVQFQDKVTAWLAEGSPSALMFLDLDNFKGINDSLGHAMGDAVLVSVAAALRTAVEGQGGLAARLAGDEFGAWLPCDDTDKLERFGRAVIEACATPVIQDTDTVIPGVSVGIATTTQVANNQTTGYDTMLRVADFALYVSKEGGRGRVTIYDSALERQYAERRALLDALPRAIEARTLDVYLQPKVEIADRRVYGFEALARWCHQGTMIPPETFIRLAEEAGLVIDIDLLILRKAAAAVERWNREQGTAFSVSVNLSALHFNSRAVVEAVAETLRATGLPPALLTLEVTETVQLKRWDKVQGILGDLRALGCRISIDDFGSGYSSLAYLRAMMADELKIDRSLVDEIETSDEARFIVDAVIDLADSLSMQVVVEGVQTESQARLVHDMGCHRAQGFLYGHPIPAEAALAEATGLGAARPRSLAV